MTSRNARAGRARLIKRYANRKLYDTRASRYVTLQQIGEFVRGGEDVSIVDNTTKEDLTQVTLAQILYEEERKTIEGGEEQRRLAGNRAPQNVGALRALIQEGGERLFSTLRDIAPVTSLREINPSRLLPRWETSAELESEERLHSVLTAGDAWDQLQRVPDERVRLLLGHSLAHIQQLQAELTRLRSRVDELDAKQPASLTDATTHARHSDAKPSSQPALRTMEESSISTATRAPNGGLLD